MSLPPIQGQHMVKPDIDDDGPPSPKDQFITNPNAEKENIIPGKKEEGKTGILGKKNNLPQKVEPVLNDNGEEKHHQQVGEFKPSYNAKQKSVHYKTAVFFFVSQIGIIVIYATCCTFAIEVAGSGVTSTNTIQDYYPMFQDVHVMIFIGFGFLMTFLKYHSWSSVMFTYLVAAWSIQWGIACIGFFHQVFDDKYHKIELDITDLIEGDFAAGAVLISFGAVLGKVNSLQLLVMATIEIFFYSLNVGLGQKEFKAVDMGGSMYVHTFGAMFGIGCAWTLGPKNLVKKITPVGSLGANYNSEMFGAIGTVFLWMFWPSFNGCLATGNSQHRVIVNTVLAISSSCIGSFMMSAMLNKGMYKMEDAMNASLAGGVMIGSSSDLVAASWVSMLIGFAAGIISTVAFNKIWMWFYEKCGLHDTCGVNNLHGIPGILGGIIGAISAAVANETVYGDN